MRFFASGLNVRTTWRFNARNIPMRACIMKSRPSAEQTPDRGLPFRKILLGFGRLVM
jgi:hypothetical protein